MAEKFAYKDIRNKDHSRFFLIQFFFWVPIGFESLLAVWYALQLVCVKLTSNDAVASERVLTHVVCWRYGEAPVPLRGERRRSWGAGRFVGGWRTWIGGFCQCDSGGDDHGGNNVGFFSRTPSRQSAGQCGGCSGQSRFVAAEDACWTWICRTSITCETDSCCAILSVSTRTRSNACWKETVKCEALGVAKRISHFSGGFAHFRRVWPAAVGM